MTKQLFALSLGFAGLIWAMQNSTASAAPACGERGTVVERLQSRYGETRQSIGLGNGDQVVEVFASTETGTWTIVVTMPNGATCLLASGESFEHVGSAPAPKGDPA